jgi:glutaconyl-CoA decarboxylase
MAVVKRRFRVTVDGQAYEVELEELLADESGQKAVTSPAHSGAAAPRAAAPTPERRPASAVGGSGVIKAPLPGMVLDVKVKVGSRVTEGQVLVILEAMKMENEIVAPRDGTVEQVAVEKGSPVAEGDDLVVLG